MSASANPTEGLARAVLAGFAWLGAAAGVCLLLTIVVAGATSHYGAAAAGRVVVWLGVAEIVLALLALLGFARTLRRLATPRRWLWLLGAVLLTLPALAGWAFVTLVLFNR